MVKKRGALISHKQILRITKPSYFLGLWGGVITSIVAVFLLVRLLIAGELFQGMISAVELVLFTHLSIGVLMLLSVYLLRKEHHCFGGSIMLLCVSIIGLTFASGLMIGPVLGMIAGIMGLSEHEKLIKHHL